MSFITQLYYIFVSRKKSLLIETGPNIYYALSSHGSLITFQVLAKSPPLQRATWTLPQVGPTPCPLVFYYIIIFIALYHLVQSLITLFIFLIFLLR